MNKVYIVTKKPQEGGKISRLCRESDISTTLTTNLDLFKTDNLSGYGLVFIDAIFKKPTQPEGAQYGHSLNDRGIKTYILVDNRSTIPWIIYRNDQAQNVLVKDDTLDDQIRAILAETFINP